MAIYMYIDFIHYTCTYSLRWFIDPCQVVYNGGRGDRLSGPWGSLNETQGSLEDSLDGMLLRAV